MSKKKHRRRKGTPLGRITAVLSVLIFCGAASVPVLLSALGANTAGKRTAVSYLVASFMGVMVCAALFYIADAMFRFPFLDKVMDPFSLALTNTVLRLAILCLLAPFTVLPGHAALVTALEAGDVRYVESGAEKRIRIKEGFAEVKDNVVTVCVEA